MMYSSVINLFCFIWLLLLSARDEEKAQHLMNRYLAGAQEKEREQLGKAPKKRPKLASECSDLSQADKFYHQITREIGQKVMDIQNSGLGEARIRDLNDEINKLLRERGHWARRIVELGGPNYRASSTNKVPEVDADDSPMVQAGPGYKYFGAAKKLPGVKELFEQPSEAGERQRKKKSKAQLHAMIDVDYYGFRDEDDNGELVEHEAQAEAELREAAKREYRAKAQERAQARGNLRSLQAGEVDETDPTDAGDAETLDDDALYEEPADVPLPGEAVVTAAGSTTEAGKRKRQLLQQYASNALIQEQQEAEELLKRRQQR
jgi:pre-mRNA-splicing factor ISY1